MENFLIGDGGVHSGIAGNDLETASVKLGELSEVIYATVEDHPIAIEIIVMNNDLGSIVGALLLDRRPGISGENILQIPLLTDESIKGLVDKCLLFVL
jgi:hypothetical protein